MVAGGISRYGKTELMVVPDVRTLDGGFYRGEILPEHLRALKSMLQFPKQDFATLMQDGALAHTAKDSGIEWTPNTSRMCLGVLPPECAFVIRMVATNTRYWCSRLDISRSRKFKGNRYFYRLVKILTLLLTHFHCHCWPQCTHGLSMIPLGNEGMVRNPKLTLDYNFSILL